MKPSKKTNKGLQAIAKKRRAAKVAEHRTGLVVQKNLAKANPLFVTKKERRPDPRTSEQRQEGRQALDSLLKGD